MKHIAFLLLIFPLLSMADDRSTEKMRLLSEERDGRKGALLSSQDNATVTVYYKSGAVQAIRFDSTYGSLSEISEDFAGSAGQPLIKLYTYRSISEAHGVLTVNFAGVEGVNKVER